MMHEAFTMQSDIFQEEHESTNWSLQVMVVSGSLRTIEAADDLP
jgi:hypothetical protein